MRTLLRAKLVRVVLATSAFALLVSVACQRPARPAWIDGWTHVGSLFEGDRTQDVYRKDIKPNLAAGLPGRGFKWSESRVSDAYWVYYWDGSDSFVLEDSHWASDIPGSSDRPGEVLFIYHLRKATLFEQWWSTIAWKFGLDWLNPGFSSSSRLALFGGFDDSQRAYNNYRLGH